MLGSVFKVGKLKKDKIRDRNIFMMLYDVEMMSEDFNKYFFFYLEIC